MNKKAAIVIILLIAGLSFAGYTFYSKRSKGIAGLKVTSTPTTSIFLNDKLIGKTPYEDKHPPGEYILKLIPEDSSTTAISWQGKVNLAPALLTYVNRELGTSELTSAGEILSLEKIPGNEAQVAVFSKPDAATVVFDGQDKGATVVLLNSVTPGEHDVAVSSPGFASRTVRISATAGYKLSVNFQLALLGGDQQTTSGISPTPGPPGTSSSTLKPPYVVIKDTPTGFLRVRSSPSTSATESAQVKPGEKFPLLDEKEGWYQITYIEGKVGWISGRYADKVE